MASAIAIVLSLASIIVATREPEVLMLLPDQVRLVSGRVSGYSYLYLQPAFVSTGANDRIEVVSDMSVRVRRADGSEPTVMAWREQVAFEPGPDGRLSYRYEDDAVPLLVSPRSAEQPLALFRAPNGWFFEAGTYEFELRAERVVSSTPLRATFEVTLDAEHMAFLDAAGTEPFLAFPIEAQ